MKKNSRKWMRNLPSVIPSLFPVWEISPNEEHFHTVSLIDVHTKSYWYVLWKQFEWMASIYNYFVFHFSGVLGFCFDVVSKYFIKSLTWCLLIHQEHLNDQANRHEDSALTAHCYKTSWGGLGKKTVGNRVDCTKSVRFISKDINFYNTELYIKEMYVYILFVCKLHCTKNSLMHLKCK